jgi:prephenate dehydratase
VELCLIGAPGARFGAGAPDDALSAIREIRSHPVALEQVRGLIAAHPGWKRSVTTDTAGAVAEIVALGDPGVAAIGPALAAELYGGVILARSVQDASENYTRFFLLARGDATTPLDEDGAQRAYEDSPRSERACVGIAVADRPGSLRDALSAFADRGIDLRFLIARPDRSVPFRYRFFVELAGVDEPRLAAALADIGGEQRVFGRY